MKTQTFYVQRANQSAKEKKTCKKRNLFCTTYKAVYISIFQQLNLLYESEFKITFIQKEYALHNNSPERSYRNLN